MKQIKATSFKTHCLKVMDDIHHYQTEITVTKRGKPWVKVVPIGDMEPPTLIGSMVGLGKSIADLTKAIDEDWDAQR